MQGGGRPWKQRWVLSLEKHRSGEIVRGFQRNAVSSTDNGSVVVVSCERAAAGCCVTSWCGNTQGRFIFQSNNSPIIMFLLQLLVEKAIFKLMTQNEY